MSEFNHFMSLLFADGRLCKLDVEIVWRLRSCSLGFVKKQKTLVDWTGADKSNVSKSLKRLQECGYIKRVDGKYLPIMEVSSEPRKQAKNKPELVAEKPEKVSPKQLKVSPKQLLKNDTILSKNNNKREREETHINSPTTFQEKPKQLPKCQQPDRLGNERKCAPAAPNVYLSAYEFKQLCEYAKKKGYPNVDNNQIVFDAIELLDNHADTSPKSFKSYDSHKAAITKWVFAAVLKRYREENYAIKSFG